MATFEYTARDKFGKIQRGEMFALDRTAASGDLVAKSLSPILIKEKAEKLTLKGILSKLKISDKVKLTDKVIFSRQFATMINAGVPIVQTLNILKEQTVSKKLQTVVADVGKRVEGGASLASALAEHRDVFTPVYINMIRAGETGGILDQVLERLATQQEKDAEIIGKVRGALIYPGVITAVTIGAFIFLMTVIVPKLSVIFESFGTSLPVYTKIMLGISHVITHYGLFVLAGLVALGVAFYRFVHTTGGRKLWHRAVLKTPIFGPIVAKVNVARFARTFGSLMTSGISILDALNSTAAALGNEIFKDEVTRIAGEVKKGRPVAESLRQGKLFPPIVSQMIAVGEETGQLDALLLKLADFYEKEVDRVVAGIASIIEPILIIILGVMVGFVVISVFGPISSLSNAI